MADIDIVPKHHSYTWLWILIAIVIIAAVVWYVMAGGAHANRVGALLEHGPLQGVLSSLDALRG